VNRPTQFEFAAVIPAFNEAKSIAAVVEAVKQYALPIVVDDGSYDETARLANQAGAVVVSHTCNQGYDAALETGLFKAIELGCTFAITMDADGQHNPAGIEPFKAALIQGADLVVGVRDRHQRFSESIFAVVGKIRWGIPDPLCGMKGYRLIHLKHLGSFDTYKSIGTEFAIRCACSKLVMEMLPIKTYERLDASRFGSGLKSNYQIIRSCLLGLILGRSIYSLRE
jgi:glycosyltransferase involved in cell wall biosynthesis